jgi:K+-transporting ATPase ATPase A chain
MGTEYMAVGVTILVTIATSLPLGQYMAKVFTGGRTRLDSVFLPIERLIFRLTGTDPKKGQDWKQYSVSLLMSNGVMWLATFAVVSLQKALPLNPDGIANMEPTLAFNTISSFTSNTDLQHYSGETGLSYFSQMFAMTFLQFVTAATGIAACAALMRALAGNRTRQMGNFYVDVVRANLRVLLPPALIVATLLMWQGSPMTFQGAAKATTVE